ncbi:MAG: ribosome-associated translation inhibitor RaiA [Bryobacterales bacterium]|nr:ribosome-associated translation inhibitor RaiA [Bryobacterales bacterium]
MKVTYTGRQVELGPPQMRKIETRFLKIGKLLDGKEEREARVILSQERHLHHAEITVNYRDHSLVVVASDADLFTAILSAAEKLEKQALRVREKWRDTKRQPRKEEMSAEVPETSGAPVEEEDEGVPEVFRVNHHQRRKPMALEEALLEIQRNKTLDYVVYRDIESDRVCVLLRRRDGNFDLVEA